MRVLLLNLPWSENGRLGVRAGSRWPFTSKPEKDGCIHYIPFPFFLAYATSLLKKENKDAKLIDAIAAEVSEENFLQELKAYNPGLIVIETSTPSFKNDLRIIRNIHQFLPDRQIALCGSHASVFPEQILKEYVFINYILIGEYEYTLLELVNHLDSHSSLESVSGLAYRNGKEIRVNKARATIDNLDSLPWPEREDVPIYKYNDGFAGLPSPNVQMWSSRGCSFRCAYCLWPQTMYREHRCRMRSPIKVADEMEHLIKKFGFKAIYFDDDLFNTDRNHVLGICEEIKKRKIRIPWAAMARADLADHETLRAMAQAGVYALKYGIESANQGILNTCAKLMNLTHARETITLTKELGIKVHLTFCLGLPGETAQTIKEDIRFLEEIHPDSCQFSFATPFPGTDYFEFVKSRGWLLTDNWSDYDGNQRCIVRTQALSAEEIAELKEGLVEFFAG